MKLLYIFCAVFLAVAYAAEVVEKEVETLDGTIQRVVQESKNDTLIVSGKEGTPENFDTPKYVREFGSNLEKFAKGLEKSEEIEKFIKEVESKIDGETKRKLEKLMLELAKEEIDLMQEEKEEATRVVSVTSKKMTPAEIAEKAKKQVDGMNATKFVVNLISKVTEGDDRMTHIYFSYALKMLEEVMVHTASANNLENVKRLAKCKLIVEEVVKGSSPFYKTGWFITTIVLFVGMVVGVSVFVFIVIRKGTSVGSTTTIK